MSSRNATLNIGMIVVLISLPVFFLQFFVGLFNDISFQNNILPYFHLVGDQSNIIIYYSYNYFRLLYLEMGVIVISFITLDSSLLLSIAPILATSVFLIFGPIAFLNSQKTKSTY